MKILIAIAALTLVAADNITFYKTCGSNPDGQIISVDVTPCGASNECLFPIGGYTNVTVTFIANKEVTHATPHVYAIMFGLLHVPAPFKMETDSCDNFDTGCPIQAGQTVQYHSSVFVESSYPAIRTVAEWQIHDQNNHNVFCLDIPVHLNHANPVG